MPIFTAAGIGELVRRGEWEAFELQFEYVAWRRGQGLEPTAEQLNRFELAWDLLGEAIDAERREGPGSLAQAA